MTGLFVLLLTASSRCASEAIRWPVLSASLIVWSCNDYYQSPTSAHRSIIGNNGNHIVIDPHAGLTEVTNSVALPGSTHRNEPWLLNAIDPGMLLMCARNWDSALIVDILVARGCFEAGTTNMYLNCYYVEILIAIYANKCAEAVIINS